MADRRFRHMGDRRLVNTSLPPGAGWDACIASLGRPAAQNGIKALTARGLHEPGDVENRLGYYLGQLARSVDAKPMFANCLDGNRFRSADLVRRAHARALGIIGDHVGQ